MFLAFGANFLVMSCIYNVDIVVTHLLCIYWSLPRLCLRVVFELKILPVLPPVCPSVFAACFNLNILRNPANTNNIVGFFLQFFIFPYCRAPSEQWIQNWAEFLGIPRFLCWYLLFQLHTSISSYFLFSTLACLSKYQHFLCFTKWGGAKNKCRQADG